MKHKKFNLFKRYTNFLFWIIVLSFFIMLLDMIFCFKIEKYALTTVIAFACINIDCMIYFLHYNTYIEYIISENAVCLKIYKQKELCDYVYTYKIQNVAGLVIILLVNPLICFVCNLIHFINTQNIILFIIYNLINTASVIVSWRSMIDFKNKISKCNDAVKYYEELFERIENENEKKQIHNSTGEDMYI